MSLLLHHRLGKEAQFRCLPGVLSIKWNNREIKFRSSLLTLLILYISGSICGHFYSPHCSVLRMEGARLGRHRTGCVAPRFQALSKHKKLTLYTRNPTAVIHVRMQLFQKPV